MTDADRQSLYDKLRRLNLGAFIDGIESLHDTDPDKAVLITTLLKPMADDEIGSRFERTIKRRIKEARFIRLQTVDSFNFDYNPSTRKLKKRYLKLLHADPVAQGVGAVLVGNSGLGKTHLARALGYATCQRGHSVLFVPCATLLNHLVAAEASKELGRQVKKYHTPSLLIIDELAYLTMSHQEANLFFQVVSRRHDNDRPTVVTTNKPFAEWNQVFHGDSTAHAIVDRLTERAEIFYLEGTSYRQTHRKGIDSTPAAKRNSARRKSK
jgi:DNA replication protein DnaC